MSVAISPEQLAELNKKLSIMRHNVNNHLSMVVAASELMRRKPEMTARMLDNILLQPEKITEEVRAFSAAFEELLGLKTSGSRASTAVI